MAECIDLRDARRDDDYRLVSELFREYFAWLSFEITFQDVAGDIADPRAVYGPPAGRCVLATVEGEPAGVVALSHFDDGMCEMKRLWVRPEAQGRGVGRLLAETIVQRARDAGYRAMVLDTVPELTAAIALYESMGFRDTPAYRYNPRPGARYLRLDLTA